MRGLTRHSVAFWCRADWFVRAMTLVVVLCGVVGCEKDHQAAPSHKVESQTSPPSPGGGSGGDEGDGGGGEEEPCENVDPTFGTGGVVELELGTGDSEILDLEVDLDGCIVAVGMVQVGDACKMAIARFRVNGELDFSFGKGGMLFPCDGIARRVCIQADGRIVVAGIVTLPEGRRCKILRFLKDGSIDLSFGAGGEVLLGCEPEDDELDLCLQADGKLLLGCRGSRIDVDLECFLVVRLRVSGEVDLSFGSDGWFCFDVGIGIGRKSLTSIDVRMDGRIVVAGSVPSTILGKRCTFAALLNHTGGLDLTFGVLGVSLSLGDPDECGSAIKVIPNGTILVGGSSLDLKSRDFMLLCLKPNGILDLEFAVGGKVTVDFCGGEDRGLSLEVDVDGRICSAGAVWDGSVRTMGILRCLPNGLPDKLFHGTGKCLLKLGALDALAHDLCLLQDGRMILGGFIRKGIRRVFALVCHKP